jgi:CBS-domain-containing membrane protein
MKTGSLAKLTAADIMHRDVITVGPDDTLREAMGLMTENHVAGMPVMDGHSRCVGVISASDILTYEQEHAEADGQLAQHYNADLQRWESVRVSSFALEEFGDVRVHEVMSTDLISVRRDTPVAEVARSMAAASVHRVLVLDQHQRLFGVISAFDFVSLFARLGD